MENPSTVQHAVQQTPTSGKTPAKAWLILVVVYFLSFMAPVCQFKVPPLASWIIPAYGLDGVTFGYLMSALSIIGFILAIPAAFICKKMGLKKVTALAGVCFVIGAVMAALTTSIAVLYISRLIEGIGIGLIGVSAPTCISIWFPEKTRGLALGIWATWMPVGITLMFNLAPAIATVSDYTVVFWIVALLSLIALILFVCVYKDPEGVSVDMGVEGSLRDSFKYLKNKYIWFLGIGFIVFNFIQLGVINSFYNTYLEAECGFDAITAGSITSILTIMAIFLQPVVGAITDRFKPAKKRIWIVLTYALFIVAFIFAFNVPSMGMVALVIFIAVAGVAGGMGGGSIRPLAPILLGGSAMGATMAMSVLQLCQNFGATIGAPVFGWAFETFGWANAGYITIMPLLVIAIIASCLITPKAFKTEDAECGQDIGACPDQSAQA